jgi:hypothetical protein
MKQWNEIMHLRMDVSSNLHFILNDVVVLETTFYFTCCGSIENNNTMKLSTKASLSGSFTRVSFAFNSLPHMHF